MLETHLSCLKRQGLIRPWRDRAIEAGVEWAEDIKAHLESAQIILLLISPDFMASDYCYDIEMKRAIERHQEGTAKVIPIILRPVDWQGTPFSKLQSLPTDGRAITVSSDLDTAFFEVARGIRQAIAKLSRSKKSPKSRRSVPPLLPYRTDRGEQFYTLAEAVGALKQLPARKPLICLVHGGEDQCHAMFLECLKDQDHLPNWLSLEEAQTSVTSYNLGWPARLTKHCEPQKRLTRNLAQRVLNRGSASKQEINDTLAAIPGPVIIHTQLYTEDWQQCSLPVTEEYLRFWQTWPELYGQQALIVCLCIKYQTKKNIGWLKRRRFQSMNQKIQKELETLKVLKFSQFDRLIGIVLDELPSITRTEVEQWVYDMVKPHWGEHWGEEILNDLMSAIRELFEDWEKENQSSVIPMENLAQYLFNVLKTIPGEKIL